MNIYESAFNEEFKTVDELLHRGGNPDMAIMGVCAKQQQLLRNATRPEEIKKVFSSLSDDDKKSVRDLENRIWWCVEKGACLLFGIQQPPRKHSVSVMNYNKNISMTRGPGDVAKGTFKKK